MKMEFILNTFQHIYDLCAHCLRGQIGNLVTLCNSNLLLWLLKLPLFGWFFFHTYCSTN